MTEHKMSRRSFVSKMGAVAVSPTIASGACGYAGPAPATSRATGSKPDTSRQIEMTASEAVIAIADGRLSAETYVRTLLAHGKAVSGYNAMISWNDEEAIRVARSIDALRQSGQQLPLLAGLPIVVKDNINTKGLPTTGATPALEHFVPTNDAWVVTRLIEAGAIVLGKANMHELAFGITTTNFASFAGIARNPYDSTRMVGGSSGGTGVAIAARIAPGGLGTDTGGSVRIPAALNGIAGLRPSVGNGGKERRYDGTGVLPLSHTRDTVGPMGRTVEDVALLDAAITRTDVADSAPLRGLRLGIPTTYWDVVDAEVLSVMKTAMAKLEHAGVTFVEVDLPNVRSLAAKTGFRLVFHEAALDMPKYFAASGATDITVERIAAAIANPDVKAGFQAVLQRSPANEQEYANAVSVFRPAMRAQFDAYFKINAVDAILSPTTPLAAVHIDAEKGSSTVSINGGPPVNEFETFIRNCDPGSIVGIPGITLPAGMTEGGLPVGISLDGPVGSDRQLLAIGISMERLLGTLPSPKT